MKLILKDEVVKAIKSYRPLMYRNTSDRNEVGLRTGDVVQLELSDFKIILRNYPLLEKLLESYHLDNKYRSKYWAILNKPCDMVHNSEDKRVFDTNLFLCPLQSLLHELKPSGAFKKYVNNPKAITPCGEKLKTLLMSFLNTKLNREFKISPTTPAKEKEAIIKTKTELQNNILTSLDEKIFSSFSEIEDPETIESSLHNFASEPGNFHEFINDFFLNLSANKEWNSYKEERESALKSIQNIEISKSGISTINELFLNQLDSRGIFFYEPTIDLLSKEVDDFSFFIELEDMLTLKVNKESIDDGTLVNLLINKRKIGLNRNFSDRLQNIMGYYFSKIGTADVKTDDVLSLYSTCFEKFIFKK